jgi:CheY-like chemotaxis protein
MDGLETVNIIRKSMSLTTPVIALTANAFKEERDRCIEAGMNDYVTKPFDESTLLGAIVKNLPGLEMMIHHQAEIISGPAKKGKLYDLSYLKEYSNGDPEFIKKLIQLFLEIVPETVREIRTGWENGDHKTVYGAAHRVKPTIEYFNIAEIKQDIKELELQARSEEFSRETESMIDHIESILMQVTDDLKNEL